MKILGFAGSPMSDAGKQGWQRYVLALAGQHLSTANATYGAMLLGPNLAKNPHGDNLCVLKGTPRWMGPALPSTDPANMVLAAYERYGDAFLEHLHGSFALALVDVSRQRLLLAIDRMGVERMAYAENAGTVRFGSSAEELARSPLLKFQLSQQGLYDFLMMHMIPAPNTIFAGVNKLRAGTVATYENGKLTIRRYWQPQFAEGRNGESLDILKSDLHTALMAAVQSCNPDTTTGAFLSGGLDSSSVTGMLARASETPARTFSMGFGVDAYDELSYARIAAKQFKCNAVEYHVTPEDIVKAFPLIAGAYDEPFGNSSAVPTYVCALRAREQGVTHLLAGDGGDEIFGGNDRYVSQRIFEWYRRVPSFLRKGLLEPISQRISPESALMPLRKMRSYVDQARIPLPERLESWNFIYRHGTDTMLDPDFARSINPRAPFAVMDEVYHSAPSNVMLHQMLFYDWQFTLSDNDLRKVGTMCDLAGIKVSYPMLDQRVVDLSLRVTPRQKIKGLELRSFYKTAMKGFLPEEILNKTKHGFGLPFGVWLKTHQPLSELIYSHLHALKQRHIVRATFIDQLIADHMAGHASYFGYAIWDLAMLEAWLQRHGQAHS